MATMALHDMIRCPECNGKMFPCAFDKDERFLAYKCTNDLCNHIERKSFDEVKVQNGESPKYFVLNDDGGASWKCICHGVCDFEISQLLGSDFSKFEKYGCLFATTDEEAQEDAEYAQGEGKDQLKKIFSALSEDQLSELADSFLMYTDISMYGNDYLAAFIDEYLIGMSESYGVFEGFIDRLIESIYDLFEISFNNNFDVEE